MKKLLRKEDGVMIIEATLVFPVMFLIIFLMFFLGNAYFQMSRVEAVAAEMAFYGAAQCSDPMLKTIEETGKVPEYNSDYEVEPYRYIFGGMDDIENDVELQIVEKINSLGTGFFGGMKIKVEKPYANFHNIYIYSTFTVEIQYEIPFPMRLFGMDHNFKIEGSERYDVPVSDTSEFIRNVNMVTDWVEASESGQKAIVKTKEIMSKVAEFIN